MLLLPPGRPEILRSDRAGSRRSPSRMARRRADRGGCPGCAALGKPVVTSQVIWDNTAASFGIILMSTLRDQAVAPRRYRARDLREMARDRVTLATVRQSRLFRADVLRLPAAGCGTGSGTAARSPTGRRRPAGCGGGRSGPSPSVILHDNVSPGRRIIGTRKCYGLLSIPVCRLSGTEEAECSLS